MHQHYDIRAGSTDPVVFVLGEWTNDGKTFVAVNLTTLGVETAIFHRKTKAGTADQFSTADVDPKVAITDAPNGKVTFTPTADSWAAAADRYSCYFETRDDQGEKITFYPSDGVYTISIIS